MRVVVAESPEFAPEGLRALREAGWDVTLHAGPLAALPEALQGADGAVVRFGLRWDAALLRRVSGLTFLAVAATGTDHVDAAAAAAAGIAVVSLAGHPGLRDITATPEHALGLVLALLRGTVAAHQAVLAGRWDRSAHVGRQLRGRSLGIVGLGRTGTALADMADALGATVSYHDPHVTSARWPRHDTLAALAAASEIISVHALLDATTTGLLDARFMQALRPGAFLVNTARGALIDEEALLQALDSGRLAGAALDVVADEPPTGHPIRSPLVEYARRGGNLLLTPHIGGATHDSLVQAECLLAEELVRRFGGDGCPAQD